VSKNNTGSLPLRGILPVIMMHYTRIATTPITTEAANFSSPPPSTIVIILFVHAQHAVNKLTNGTCKVQ